MNAQTRKLVSSTAMICLTAAFAHPAQAAPLSDIVSVGSNGSGQPCTATRDWSRSSSTIKSERDQPYILTCRGASAAKTVGLIARTSSASVDPALRDCGAESVIALEGLGPVRVRLCQDRSLGIQVVEFTAKGRNGEFLGASENSAAVPMARILRALTSGHAADLFAAWQPALDLANLGAAPAATLSATKVSDFSLEGALQQGILFIRGGELVSASRLLNDAVSRVTPDTATGTVIELQLATALADSGLGQFGPAQESFAVAERLLSSGREIDRAAYLEASLRTYRALDAINRRDWKGSLGQLDRTARASYPLTNPVILSSINRDTERTREIGISLRDRSQYNWLVLEVQRHYARSVALLGQGKIDQSAAALSGPDGVVTSFRTLEQIAQPESIAWLRARVQLQFARVAARAQRREEALAAYSCAIRTMKGIPWTGSASCPVAAIEKLSQGAGIGDATAIASVQLERAAVASQGMTGTTFLADYREAIDTLINSGRANVAQPPALIGYLDLLLAESKVGSGTAIEEDYFRALQAISDPAIAGDMVRLGNVVSADGTIAANLQERNDLARQITQLRYLISALPQGSDKERSEFDKQRASAEARQAILDGALQGDARFRGQDDSPIKLADLQQSLQPGEIYLKLSKIRTRMFGMAISRERSWIYSIDAPSESIENFSRTVVESARSHQKADGTSRIDAFAVQTSNALFNAITGPAKQTVASANAVVFDPSGVLRMLPAGVLVTDEVSVRQYRAGKPNDYSNVRFLAAKADISTAFSPRSFLVVRSKVAPSTAAHPLIGFAQNAPAPAVSPELAAHPVLRGSGCAISYGSWAAIKNANRPISAVQLQVVASALGFPTAPEITGEAFSDVAIQQASRDGSLAQYQVLHFSTHGLPQLSIAADGCSVELPPSLVTSMASPPPTGPIVSDGLLSFEKVARLNLNANLVVLAACETGAGAGVSIGRLAGQEDSSAGTLDGLVRAFVSANARAVMATYWRVPATVQADEFMATFYGAGRTGTIGSALRAAQTGMIGSPRYSHPYYWGAYFVVGDAGKTMLSGTPTVAEAAASGAVRASLRR